LLGARRGQTSALRRFPTHVGRTLLSVAFDLTLTLTYRGWTKGYTCGSQQSVRRDFVHWNIEIEREDDGRWIAEIAAVPGVIVYGTTEEEAKRKARALADAVVSSAVEGF
jgi:predicted RNase H-like HicB family nuclease